MPNRDHLQYIGLATQILATLGVAFFIGYRIDRYFNLSAPIAMISLPVVALFGLLWKIVKDTSKPKKND